MTQQPFTNAIKKNSGMVSHPVVHIAMIVMVGTQISEARFQPGYAGSP